MWKHNCRLSGEPLVCDHKIELTWVISWTMKSTTSLDSLLNMPCQAYPPHAVWSRTHCWPGPGNFLLSLLAMMPPHLLENKEPHTWNIVILADIVEFWIFCWTTDFKGHQGTLDQKRWEPLKYGHVSPYHNSFCIYCAWSTLTSKTTQFGRKWDWVNDSIFIFWQFPELNLMTGIATNPTEHLLPEAAPSHCPGCRTETLSAGSWLSALVRPEDTEQS